MILDAYDPQCPIRNILARLGDKWSLLVIYTLSQVERMRFGDLRRSVPDISQKMLTATLRTLEEDGFVTRTIYPEVPPRVEYSLTARAFMATPSKTGQKMSMRSIRPYFNCLGPSCWCGLQRQMV